MKINTKIILLIIGSLVLSSLIYCLTSIWQLNKSGDMAIYRMQNLGTDNLKNVKGDSEAFKQEIISQKKNYLKSQVQTTIGVLKKAYNDAHDLEKIKSFYKEQLKNTVNTAFSILVNIEKDTKLSLEDKQLKAINMIKNLRYGLENKDYFWINDMHPKMMM